MGDFLRLLSVAVLVFVIVGFALIYSRNVAFRVGLGTFASDTWSAAKNAVGLGADSDEERLAEAKMRIVRPNQSSWMGLAGFPDQVEVRFPIPQAVDRLAGDLELYFDAQLAEGGDGLLSVAVNGDRKGEIVLNTGHAPYELRVPLDDSDLLADSVVLTLSARGTTNSGQICPTETANSGSAILLLPESALVLRTLVPADLPETALILMDDPMHIDLTADQEGQAIAIWAAQLMERSGVSVLLVKDPQAQHSVRVAATGEDTLSLSENGQLVLAGRAGVDRTIAFHRAFVPATELIQWPVSVEDLGAETTARTFRTSKRWLIPYKIADLPQGRTPTRFRLAIKASPLAEDFEWVARVLLNGNLLQSVRLPGTATDIAFDVELPLDLQGLSNLLVVELVDTSSNQSICRAGPEAEAQLLPQSTLEATGAQPQDGWGALVRELAMAASVTPGNRSLVTVNQATRATTMLAEFLPLNANVSFTAAAPGFSLTVIARQELEALFTSVANGTYEAEGPVWLVTDTGLSASNPLSLNDLRSADADAILAVMHPTDIAFVVQHTTP